jgi:hypothetical protein
LTSNSAQRTLDLVRHNGSAGITTRRLSQLQDQPVASIRRNIQELRTEGHDIVYGNGFYRYWGMRTPAQTPYTETTLTGQSA